jgi:hypothetical protein
MTDSSGASATPEIAAESAPRGSSGKIADVTDDGVTRSSSTVLTWLQLMRLPTVFTALSNILCGYLITHSLPVTELLGQLNLWLLLCSTFGLYMGGMVLNDVFDASLDAIERPGRPIPSGRISRTAAAGYGAVLMAIGVSAAAFVGLPSLLIAIVIVPAVLLYNGVLKNTMAAPLGMGACRFLNLMLGASAVGSPAELFQMTSVMAAAGLGLYVVGVTVFAMNEAGTSTSRGLLAGLGLMGAGMLLDGWLISNHGATPGSTDGARMALLLLGLNLGMRGAQSVSSPQPRLIQKTVGLMLLCIIFLDAIVVFGLTADAKRAALVIMLVAPAMLLRRVVPMS